jgi:hypothetical protein
MSRTPYTDPGERAGALGGERPVPRGSFRDRIRSRRGVRHVWRVGVFLAGAICIATGFALVVLPGPLTIPPVLLGLWIWASEFHWAHRFFLPFRQKGQAAWEHAKRHPVSSTAVTVGGLLLAAGAVWAVSHFQAVDRAKDLVGLT